MVEGERSRLSESIKELKEILENPTYNEDNYRRLSSVIRELLSFQDSYIERLFFLSKRFFLS